MLSARLALFFHCLFNWHRSYRHDHETEVPAQYFGPGIVHTHIAEIGCETCNKVYWKSNCAGGHYE